MRNDDSGRLARAEEEDRLDAAWLEQSRALTNAAQKRGLDWLDALVAVIPLLPPQPAGFMQRRDICNRCGQRTVMNDDYDAVYCAQCNRWIESACDDPECSFCAERPATPLP